MVLREVGERPEFEFEIRDHLDLGLANGWIEMEKAGEASGSRFAYLLGDLVLVEMALVRFAIELIGTEGFVPVVPPVLVREGPLFGTGFFPGEREMIYEIPRDELFLVGTSEVSLAALHADEILAAGALPRRYAGFSTCFRREAGAAGKDTRGIFRVHQFDKVEMFSFVRPERLCGRARAHPGASRSGSSRPSRSRTGWWTSRPVTSAPPRRASSTARRGSRARGAIARSPRAPTPPTTRPAASVAATGPSPRPNLSTSTP